jgi:hypothetical protein
LSKQNITIKPNNHRVHPCPNGRKIELINNIISRNNNKNIVLISSSSKDMLIQNIDAPNVSILSDKEFITNEDLSCEFLISYDLADSAQIYLARVAKATEMAIILLDASEATKLYPIETLLGRVIKEEIIEGYEPVKVKFEKPFAKKISKEKIKDIAKKRYEDKTFDKPKQEFEKPKKEFKKDFKKSSDKFGDKDRKETTYKKPKKVGKTITIKERKKPDNN